MITKLTIENFFSISEAQEINLRVPKSAPDISHFRKSYFNSDNRFPVVVGFFGSNASGKSTVLRAITALMQFITSNILTSPYPIGSRFMHCMTEEGEKKPSKIKIEWETSSGWDNDIPHRFRYELHVGYNIESSFVQYEAMDYSNGRLLKNLFKRDQQHFEFGSDLREFESQKDKIREDLSVISVLAVFNSSICRSLVRSINSVRTNVFGLSHYSWNKTEGENLKFYQENPEYLQALNSELRRFDLGLEEMSIIDTKSTLQAFFHHSGLHKPIHFSEESNGTRAFVSLFPHLFYALKVGAPVIIDELEESLHHQIVTEILSWFCSKATNPNNAQLFFTSHNFLLLDEIEKEEIYFTSKLYGQPTNIYRASDIPNLRRGPSVLKKYLSGQLGAIPSIG